MLMHPHIDITKEYFLYSLLSQNMTSSKVNQGAHITIINTNNIMTFWTLKQLPPLKHDMFHPHKSHLTKRYTIEIKMKQAQLQHIQNRTKYISSCECKK